MNVKFVTITPEAEKTIAYIARVSNPSNQNNSDYAKLLRYCINHQHWSIFEQSYMTVEIETSVAIATQLLRHRSFTFQQFSQRYADVSELGFEQVQWRKQAEKNRQSSGESIDPSLFADYSDEWSNILELIQDLYQSMLSFGVAKECARFILPQCTSTRIYMSGNIRSWIHYLQLRTQEDTQLEHRQVALEIQKIFVENLPVTAAALEWD